MAAISSDTLAKCINLELAKAANIFDSNLEGLIDEYFASEEPDESDSGSETDEDEIYDHTDEAIPTVTEEEPARAMDMLEMDEGDEDDELDAPLVDIAEAASLVTELDPVSERMKVETYNCKCRMKVAGGQTGCRWQFSADEVLSVRSALSKLDRDQKDMFIMGLLAAQKVNTEETTVNSRHKTQTPRKHARRVGYRYGSRELCREMFIHLTGISNKRLTKLSNQLQDKGIVPREMNSGGRQGHSSAVSDDDQSRVCLFLDNLVEEQGISLPGRIPGFKRDDIKVLPSSITKSGIWRHYRTAMVDLGQRALGRTAFRKIWKKSRGHVVVSRPKTDLCWTCQSNNTRIMRYMLDYLAWRVATGRHREIALHFMPAGHTKFSPDWCFGLLKQTFRRTEVNCLKEMVGAVEASTQKGINRAQLVGLEDGTPLVAIHDWQTFFAEYRAVNGIKSLFHFYFDAGDPGVVRHAASLNQETGSTRLVQDIVQNGMPAVIPAPGLPLARREYLYNNIRQFVAEDWKDTMCPSV